MGGGSYSVTNRALRSQDLGYDTKDIHEIFTQRSLNNAMSPRGVNVRESRDSDEHPNSVAIILGLDVTGSMGHVPHQLVKDGLPKIMGKIIQGQEPDPQILFLGLGDHECDSAPLQVGQFESSDELVDKWLTDVYLEGGGGGNGGESYLLAWYFAAMHTSIDCFEKRGRKGFLFTIGDEPTLDTLPKRTLKGLIGGDNQFEDYTAAQLLDKAREKYNVYHVNVKTHSGSRKHVIDGWKQLMADNLIIVDNAEDVAGAIANVVLKESGKLTNSDVVGTTETGETVSEEPIL